MRKCPLCDTAMAEVPVPEELSAAGNPILIERCERCHGMYFDKSETEDALGVAESLLGMAGTMKLPPKNYPLKCPACAGKMELYRARGVMFDACPRCEGIWLDKGELESLRDFDGEDDPELEPAAEGGVRNLMDRVAALVRCL